MAEKSEKPVKKKRRLYPDGALRQAYEAVMIDDMSIYAAARAFGVPERTLSDRCKGLVALDCRPGGTSHLTQDEEKKLCNKLKELFFAGNEMTYTFMRHVATNFIRDLNKKSLKPGVMVTKKWMSAYLKRWPDFKQMLRSKAVVKIEVKNESAQEDIESDQVKDLKFEEEEDIEDASEEISDPEEHVDESESQSAAIHGTSSGEDSHNAQHVTVVDEDIQGVSVSAPAAASLVEKTPSKNAPVVYKANILRHRTGATENKEAAETVVEIRADENSKKTSAKSERTPMVSLIHTQSVASQTMPAAVSSAEVPSSPIVVVPSTSVPASPNPATQSVTLVLNQEKKKKRNYPPEAMIQAYEAVKNQGMKVYRAADVYGVPEKTLAERIAGKVAIDAKSGPRFYLTHAEEEKLCNYFTERLKKGECLTHTMMRDIASQFMLELNIKRKSDSKLTAQWLTHYLKRWPDLDELVREKLAMKEISKKMDTLYAYYEELSSLLTDFALDESPQLIYMIEETEIPQVLNNFKPVTVIAGANALGQVIPPYIVYRSLTANSDMIEGIPENAKIALEQAEVTKYDRLHAYLEAHFSQMVLERDVNKPVLVFYDSHKNNLPGKITDWANANNVFFLGYPPADVKHFIHVDCKLLGTFEWKFREACLRFSQMTRQKVTKKQISALICSAYDLALTADSVQLVFSSAGIYPYSSPVETKDSVVTIVTE